MNKKQRFLSALDSNLSKDNSVTPKICTVIIRGIRITSNTLSSTNKLSCYPKDFENDNFNSSKTYPTKVAEREPNDCKKQPHTNHLFLALKLQGSKRIIRSQAFTVNPMMDREFKTIPKGGVEENAYYNHSQNDIYHPHLLEGQQEIPLNLKFCFEYNHYNKNNVGNVGMVGNNTSCNKLCIMLQRRKHYKSKALMGYKRLAVAFINLSQISERPFCGDVPMFNNAKALALWSKHQQLTLISPEQHQMSKQDYLLSTDIFGVISFERISCEDCMTSTSYDDDGKDAVPLVHLASDNVYKNERSLVHENVSGIDTGCISTDPAETDDELGENDSSNRTGRMVRTSHVNELLKKHQQIPGNLKKKLIWMLKKLKVSEEELDMITPALNEEMVCCATSDVNESTLDEKINNFTEDIKVEIATSQNNAANKKWQIDARDLEKRLHKLLLRKRKSLKQHTLDFNSNNETDKQSNVKINDGYCFENDSFEAYPQDIVLLHKGERNDIESSIQQSQNDTTDVYSLDDEDLFNIDDLILGDDDSGEDSDEFGFNPQAYYGKRTDSKLVNKRRTYPINCNERNYPYNMTNSPSKDNADEAYKTRNYLTIRSDQEFPFPLQHLANTNRLSVNHSFRSNVNSNRCDNGGQKYNYPTVSSSTSPLDSRQISNFYLHNAEDMKRMDEFSLNSVAYNRATKPYLKPFFNSTTNSITNTNHSSSTNTMTNRSHKSNTLPTISSNIINYINTAADNITVLPTIEKNPALSEPKQLQPILPDKDESNISFLKRRSDLKSISQAFRKTTNLKFRKPNFRKDLIITDETKNDYQVIQSSTVSDDSNNKGSCCSSSETTNVNSSKKEDKRLKLVKKPVMTFIKLQQSSQSPHYNGNQKHFNGSNRNENSQDSSEQLISKSLPKRMSQSYSCSLPINRIDNNVSNNNNMSSFLKNKANLIKRNKIVLRHRSAGVDSCKEDSSFKDTNTDSEMINNGSKKRLTSRLKQPLIKSRNGFKAFTVLSLDDGNDDTTNLDGEKNGMVTSKNLRLRIPRLRKSSSNNMLKKYPLNKTDNIHIPSNNSNGANVRKKRYNTAFCRLSFNSSFNDTLTKSNLSVPLLESLLEKQFNFAKYHERHNVSKISLFTHNLILIDKNLPCSNGLYEKCNKLDYPAILLTTEDIKHLLSYLIEKINEFRKQQPPFFHNCSRHHEFVGDCQGPNTTQPTYLNHPLTTHSINASGDMGRGKITILNKSLKFLLTYVGSFKSLQLFIRLFADVFRDKDTALIEYLAFVFIPVVQSLKPTIDIVEDHQLKLNSETCDQWYTSPIFADPMDVRYHEYFLSNDWQMLQHGTKVYDDLSLQAIINRVIDYISHVNGVERLNFGEILLTFNQKSVHRQMFVPFVKEARLILTPPPKSNYFHDNNTYDGNSTKACTPTDVMRVRSLLIPSRIHMKGCDSLAKEANSRLSHRRLNSLGDSRGIDLTDRNKDNLLKSIKHANMDILNPAFQPSKNNQESQKEDVMHINRLNSHSGNQKIFDFATNYTRNAVYSDDLNPFRYTFVSPSNLNFSKLKDFSKKTVKNLHMIRDHNNVANNPLPIDIDDLASDGNEKRYDAKAHIITRKNKLVGTYSDGKNSSFTSQYILQKRSIKSGNRLKSLQITRDCNSKNNLSTIQNSNLLVLKMDLKGKKSKFKNLSSMKVTSGLKNQENQIFKNQCLKTKEDNTPNMNQNLCSTKFEAHNVRRLVVCSTKTNTHPLKVLIDNVVWENVKFFQVTPQWQTHVKYIPIAMCSTSNLNNVDYS